MHQLIVRAQGRRRRTVLTGRQGVSEVKKLRQGPDSFSPFSAQNQDLRRRRVNPYPRNKMLPEHELPTSGGVGAPLRVGGVGCARMRRGMGLL